jgi:hypothetical protein
VRSWPLVVAFVLASCKGSGETRPSAGDAAPSDASPSDAAPSDAAPSNAGRPAGDSSADLRLVVLEQGREPRVAAAFVFVPGRTGEHSLTLESRLDRGSSKLGEERVALRLGVRYLTEDQVELTLLHAETTAPDIERIESTVGARLVQKFYPSGVTEMPEITTPPAADARAGQYIKGALVQIASNLLPVVPSEPIGEGSRWSRDDLRFEMLARPGSLFVIERRSGHHGPTRLDTGETVYVSEEQTYRIEAPPDGIARHVEALLVADQPGGTVRTTRLQLDATDTK